MGTQFPLSGKTALITGASAGIGKATAETLAAHGANVAMVARRESKLRAVAETIESETDATALVLPTDVSDETAVRDAVD